MTGIGFVRSDADDPAGHMVGLTDLLWLPGGDGRLYGASRGGVLLRDGALGPVAWTGNAASGGLSAPPFLVQADLGGKAALLMPGRRSDAIDAFSRSEALTGLGGLRLGESGPQAITAMAMAGDLVVTASRQTPGLTAWRRVGDRLEPVSSAVALAGPGEILDIALQSTVSGLRVVASLSGTDGLGEVALSAAGAFGTPQRFDAYDGLYLHRPTELETLRVAGTDYLLVAAPGSSSLAVLDRLGSSALRLVDHIGDDRATRFAGIAVLETIVIGGQAYLVAGGSDDGISLMTLLPGGRLLHLASLADDLRMHLSNPTALTLGQDGSVIDIFVAGGAESVSGTGLTRLRVELGAIGRTLALGPGDDRVPGAAGRDQIHGGAGNDHLAGGAGADVLIDGPGRDRLTGGAGADVFVLVADGETDRITDFEPGTDRIDLSGWGRVYSIEGLDIRSVAGGAEIRFATELLKIATVGGGRLAAGDLAASDLFDLWHIPVAPLPESDLRLEGGAGPDHLQGQSGDDRLLGEPADPEFDAASGRVFRLYQAALGREPDLPGLMGWTGRLQTDAHGLERIASGFTLSAEFRQRYGETDSGAFVTLLYANVLGRAPDAGGFAHWTARIDTGARSREQVLIGFSESPEMIARSEIDAMAFSRTGLQAGMTDEVFRLYLAALGRLPDYPGLESWTDRLVGELALEQVAWGFVQSPEFANVYGTLSSEEFVTLLYRNVLARAPDAAGQAAWIDRLNGGWSREAVLLGFSESAEFIRASTPRLVSWMRGQGPDDLLDGGGGANILMGGMGADVFVFRNSTPGHHDIADPEPWDSFEFEGFGYASAEQVRTHTTAKNGDLHFSDQGIGVIWRSLDRLTDDMIVF